MNTSARLAAFAALALVTSSAIAQPPAALPAHTSAHGADLDTWTRRFFEWEAALPVVGGSHPGLDVGDVDCSAGQSGPVWFLELTPSVAAHLERRCTIPAGTTLYVPVLHWVCPREIDGREVVDCLADADFVLGAIDLELIVDGRVLDGGALQAYRARTGRFELAVAADGFWDAFCGCDVGTSLDFGADGISALVGPLAAGAHTITIRFASETFGFDGSLTYRIDVAPAA
jgi:hypothetical protein